MNKFSKNMNFTKSQTGFSLIELMVAMLLSLFLIGASIFVLSSNSAMYRRNMDDISVQDNARFSMDVLIDDLGMTGYYGCGRKLVNNLNLAGLPIGNLLDTTFPIDGLDDGSNTLWQAQSSLNTVPSIVAGTDAITIRKVRQKGVPLNEPQIALGAPTFLVDNVGFGANTLAVIYDCTASNLFQATAVANDSVSHAAGGSFFPGNLDVNFYAESARAKEYLYEQSPYYLANAAADLDRILATTYIAPFDAFRYFISDPTGNGPGLWREFYDPNQNTIVQIELIEGVENMQILYYVEPEGGVAPSYVRADQVNATANSFDKLGNPDGFNRVTAVKINLLVRSTDESGSDVNTQTYDIQGTPADPSDDVGPFNDRRRRTVVSTTIFFRNRSINAANT